MIPKQTKVTAVINQKGGVGKTTTAINLSFYLAKQNKKVLLVDLDPQGNATSGLGLPKNELTTTIFDALFQPTTVQDALFASTTEGLHVLAANQNLAGAEVALAELKVGRELLLANLLAQIKQGYDFVIIDCPPSLGLLTINALTAADDVLIPVQAEYYALEGLGQLLAVIQRICETVNKRLSIMGVLLTMYDSRTSLSEQVHSEVVKHFKEKVFHTTIPRNIRLAEAPSYGKAVHEHDKWSKGARAYKQLAKEFIERRERGI